MSKNVKIIMIVIIIVAIAWFIVIPFSMSIIAAPNVLNSIDKVKQNQLKNNANIIADWFEKEFALAGIGASNQHFINLCGNDGNLCKNTVNLNQSVIEASGVDVNDIELKKSTIKIQENYRVCVNLVASTKGELKKAEDVFSSGCQS